MEWLSYPPSNEDHTKKARFPGSCAFGPTVDSTAHTAENHASRGQPSSATRLCPAVSKLIVREMGGVQGSTHEGALATGGIFDISAHEAALGG